MRGRCKKWATHMSGLPREAPLEAGSNTGAALPAHEPTSLLDKPSCRQLSAEGHFRPSPSPQTIATGSLWTGETQPLCYCAEGSVCLDSSPLDHQRLVALA